jgi:hypothetical protein
MRVKFPTCVGSQNPIISQPNAQQAVQESAALTQPGVISWSFSDSVMTLLLLALRCWLWLASLLVRASEPWLELPLPSRYLARWQRLRESLCWRSWRLPWHFTRGRGQRRLWHLCGRCWILCGRAIRRRAAQLAYELLGQLACELLALALLGGLLA